MTKDLSVSNHHGLRPETLDDFARFGKLAANTAFVPKDFRGRPEDCTLAAMFGAELGLGPMQSLQSIAVVNGRPTVWGDAALALVRASGLCVAVEEGVEGDGDDRAGFCVVQRKGEKAQKRVFTVAQAKQAGLWGKQGPWQAYSERMLQLRARGFALRDVFADVLRGMVTAEEAADYQHDIPTPEPVVIRTRGEKAPSIARIAEAKATPPAPTENAFMVAMSAVAAAADLKACDSIRRKLDKSLESGRITQAEFDDLVEQVQTRANELIDQNEEAAT